MACFYWKNKGNSVPSVKGKEDAHDFLLQVYQRSFSTVQQSVTYLQASAIYNQLMDFKCSWKDVNVSKIQDSAFIGHSLPEIGAALPALSDSQHSPGADSSDFKALVQVRQVLPT